MLYSRGKFALGGLALYVISKLLDYVLGTIVRLNVESAATSGGVHDEISGIPRYLRMALDVVQNSALPFIQAPAEFLSGPYFIGFVVGALVTAFWPNIMKAVLAPISGFRAVARRRKTGLVPLVLREKFHRYAYLEDGIPIRVSSTYMGFSEFEAAAASVLVQSGLADYASFFDSRKHQNYQKIARGKVYRPYELYANQDATSLPLEPTMTGEETPLKTSRD